MIDSRDVLADVLRHAITTSGMSLTALSERCGVHRVQLSYFVHGHQDLTLRNASKVSEALGLELGYRCVSSR